MKNLFLFENENIFPLLIGIAIGILLLILITRAIFSIPAFLKHTKIQTNLLTIIAQKLGSEDEEIKQAHQVDDFFKKNFTSKAQ